MVRRPSGRQPAFERKEIDRLLLAICEALEHPEDREARIFLWSLADRGDAYRKVARTVVSKNARWANVKQDIKTRHVELVPAIDRLSELIAAKPPSTSIAIAEEMRRTFAIEIPAKVIEKHLVERSDRTQRGKARNGLGPRNLACKLIAAAVEVEPSPLEEAHRLSRAPIDPVAVERELFGTPTENHDEILSRALASISFDTRPPRTARHQLSETLSLVVRLARALGCDGGAIPAEKLCQSATASPRRRCRRRRRHENQRCHRRSQRGLARPRPRDGISAWRRDRSSAISSRWRRRSYERAAIEETFTGSTGINAPSRA
jgi:hypothetical protein